MFCSFYIVVVILEPSPQVHVRQSANFPQAHARQSTKCAPASPCEKNRISPACQQFPMRTYNEWREFSISQSESHTHPAHHRCYAAQKTRPSPPARSGGGGVGGRKTHIAGIVLVSLFNIKYNKFQHMLQSPKCICRIYCISVYRIYCDSSNLPNLLYPQRGKRLASSPCVPVKLSDFRFATSI